MKYEIRGTKYEVRKVSTACYGNDGLASESVVLVVSPQVAESLATESVNSESAASVSFWFSLGLPHDAVAVNIPQAIKNLSVFMTLFLADKKLYGNTPAGNRNGGSRDIICLV